MSSASPVRRLVMRNRRFRLPLRRTGLLLSLLFLIAGVARAEYPVDVYSARSLGMGGAARALVDDGSALDLNPAAMAGFRKYHSELGYRFYTAEGAHMVRTSFVDGLTSRLASGASFSMDFASAVPGAERPGWVVVGESAKETRSFRGQDYKLGFALPFGKFAVGTTFDWYRYKVAPSIDLDKRAFESLFTVNAAVQYVITQYVRAAVVGNNLVPTRLSSRPTTASAGVAIVAVPYLSADVDVEVDFTGKRDLLREQGAIEAPIEGNVTVDVHLGAQALMGGAFPLRFGFYTDQATSGRYLTGGIGLEFGQVGLNYGVQFQLAGDELDELTTGGRFFHMISFHYALAAGGGR